MAKKRENPRQIYAKAVEEGRDPAEAIKEFLLRKETDKNQPDHSDGEGQGGSNGKRKRADVRVEPIEDDPHSGVPKKMRRVKDVTVCAGKLCSNILTQDVRHLFFSITSGGLR